MTTETELRNATVAVTSGRLLAMSRTISRTLSQLPYPVQKILTLTLSAISWRESPPPEIRLPLSSLRIILGPGADLSAAIANLPSNSQIAISGAFSRSSGNTSDFSGSSLSTTTANQTTYLSAQNNMPASAAPVTATHFSDFVSLKEVQFPTAPAGGEPTVPLFTAAELCPKQNTVRLTLNPALSHHFGPLSRNFVTYLSTDLFSLPSPAAAALYRDLRTRCNTCCENTRIFTATDLSRLGIWPEDITMASRSNPVASIHPESCGSNLGSRPESTSVDPAPTPGLAGTASTAPNNAALAQAFRDTCLSLSHCRMLQIIPQNNALPYRPVTRQGRLIGWEIKWTVNLYPLTPREKLPSRIPEKPRLNSIHFPLEHQYTPEQMRTLELRFLDR